MFNQFWDYVTGTNRRGPLAERSTVPYDYSGLYQTLYDLYNNDAGLSDEDTARRLRTVVNRSVEFYASKLMPGSEISVITKNEQLKAALEQVIKDSNLANNKYAMLRGYALYGDSFVRVRGDDEKSILEDLSPFYVTDFDEDMRGFLTFIRIDIPILDENNRPALYTEFWDLETELYRQWQTTMSSSTPIAQLGDPVELVSFAEFGIDFIPIVHTKFRDNGDLRGLGCTYHALDKIIEANRLATRLHDMLFRFGKPSFVLSANAVDPAGRPLPPPKISTPATGADPAPADAETLFGDLIRLPGMAKLDALIPDVDYSDALAILNAHMNELENDLPELRWYALKPDAQAASGAALRTMLGAAIDRATQARNSFLSSLSRMLEMAVTIGIFNGIFPASLGDFDNGDFEHELMVDDAWAQSVDEKAATMKALTGAGVPAPAAMKLAGFTDDEVAAAFPNGMTPPPAKMPTGRVVAGVIPQSDTIPTPVI